MSEMIEAMLQKDGEVYIFRCNKKDITKTLFVMDEMVKDENLSFDPIDALVLSKNIFNTDDKTERGDDFVTNYR